MAIRNEKDVKREVKKLLKKYGWYYWMPSANAFGVDGVADFNCIRNKVFFAIETKFGNNKPTVPQYRYLLAIRENGGYSMVVNETNLEVLEMKLALI